MLEGQSFLESRRTREVLAAALRQLPTGRHRVSHRERSLRARDSPPLRYASEREEPVVAVNLDGQTRQDETIEMDGGSPGRAHSAHRQPHSRRLRMGLQ